MAVNAGLIGTLQPIQTLDTANPLLQAAQIRNQRKVADAQLETNKLAQLDARDKRRLQSVAQGLVGVKSVIDSGGDVGQFLQNRRMELGKQIANGEDVDTKETDEALAMYKQDPTQFGQFVNSSISGLQQLGVLKETETKGGFSLKPGETRYDAHGKAIVTAAGDATGGTKIPSGYRATPDGKGLEPIPGGPAEKENASDAGKLSIAQSFDKNLPEIQKNLVDNFSVTDFNLNRGDTGRSARKLREAIGGALYLKTGAAATPSEVDEQAKLYMPSSTDTKETRQQKVDSLNEFLTQAATIANAGRRKNTQPPSTETQTPEPANKPQVGDAIINGKINYANPKVQQAFDEGYSAQDIINYLGAK